MPLSRRHALFRTGTIQGVTGIYGPGIAFDQLGNLQVGGPASGANNTFVAYRFKAAASSTLVSVRWYCIDFHHPGYGGGTGGTMRHTIEADSSGIPSGVALATKDVVGPVDDFQLYTFTSPATLTAGNYYHLVFTNVDPSPIVNFVSVDGVFNRVFSPRQPRFTDLEWAVLRKFGTSGSWAVEPNYTPILQIIYGDGTTQGMGYMEANQSNYGTITGTNSMVRELFTVSGGSRNVVSVAVRVIRASGSTDPLLVRLEDNAGSLIDSGSIPAASVAAGDPATGHGYEGVWTEATFGATQALTNGNTYRLRLSCAVTSTYYAFPVRRGVDYSFVGPQTYFSDGKSQFTSDGSTWASLGRVTDENDLQFYFHTV